MAVGAGVLLVLLVLFTASIGGSDATWCVCRSDASTAALQKTIDYACGSGADCSPILQNGACYNPNTVIGHCNYAANSYFQRKGQASGTCDFASTATITTTDPSYSGCSFPSSTSTAGTGITPTAGTPGTTTTGTPTSTTPTSTTNGILGGLGPSSTLPTTDGTGAGHRLTPVAFPLSMATTVLSGLVLLRRS
uniref:Glucan endo-1,3-beta-glucosidase-like protein 2 n=1 Tax=Anthurium amnicola TaxID=1678845 RepID=A0A1D1YSV5_9ARAE